MRATRADTEAVLTIVRTGIVASSSFAIQLRSSTATRESMPRLAIDVSGVMSSGEMETILASFATIAVATMDLASSVLLACVRALLSEVPALSEDF